jgi:copper chaperone CopZ
MNSVQFNVSGIRNGQCKTQIKNALDKVKGVQEVGVSLKAGSVLIEYNEPADENQIKSCIESTGFKII